MALRNILVPTDLSTPAASALQLAAGIARRGGASITLAHVHPVVDLALIAVEPMYVPPTIAERLRQGHESQVSSAMAELAGEIPDEISHTIATRRGDTVSGILELAEAEQSDLIVMGSRGRGASRFLLGSVAAKVARAATCPVLVVRAGKDESWSPQATGAPRRALVAVNYSPFSQTAARFAAQLLAVGGCLELVHIWDDHSEDAQELFAGRAELSAAAETARAQEARRLEEFAFGLDLPCRIDMYLAAGNAPSAIIDRASESGADLIVVGAHARKHLEQRLLGTTADNVLRHAGCPVLVIPDTALERRRRSRAAASKV